MVKYICKRCGKEFSQKSHYDSHNRRKTPCENNVDKIKTSIASITEIGISLITLSIVASMLVGSSNLICCLKFSD